VTARVPKEAYEVRLAQSGGLRWIERGSGKPVEHDAEPGASAAKRARVWALSLLPVEWLL